MATNLDRYLEMLTTLSPVPDPTRMTLLFMIAVSPRTLPELAEATGRPPDVVAGHLDVLRSLGCITPEGVNGATRFRLDEPRLRAALADLAPVPDDFRSGAGQPAPPFRLPAAGDGEVALADCLRRGPTMVWFSRGLSCPICRRHRAQLTLAYPNIQALGAEVLEVTPTPLDHAAMYFANYQLVFPYLCDPSDSTAARYGVKRGTFAALPFLRTLISDMVGPKEVVETALTTPGLPSAPQEIANSGAEDGFFIVDRSGIVRFAQAGAFIGIPANHEIERQLRQINERETSGGAGGRPRAG